MRPTGDGSERASPARAEDGAEQPRWWWLGVPVSPGTVIGMVVSMLVPALPFAAWSLYTEGLLVGGLLIGLLLLVALTMVLFTYLSVLVVEHMGGLAEAD